MPSSDDSTDSDLPDTSSSDELTAVGFYTVVQLDSIGFCGGYLTLNRLGRPTEFHCTLPVLPERAQSILYGESLRPFLHSEHLGPALLAKARTSAQLVLVDQVESLGVSQLIAECVAIVKYPRESTVDPAVEPALSWRAAIPEQRDTIREWINSLNLDLAEPFQRIRSAIQEAHMSTRAA